MLRYLTDFLSRSAGLEDIFGSAWLSSCSSRLCFSFFFLSCQPIPVGMFLRNNVNFIHLSKVMLVYDASWLFLTRNIFLTSNIFIVFYNTCHFLDNCYMEIKVMSHGFPFSNGIWLIFHEGDFVIEVFHIGYAISIF